MRNFTKNNVLALVSCAALLFSACGDDSKNAGGSVEDQEIIAISDKTVTGVSQKGPFVNGSSVTVQELNGETLAQTGLGFEGKIKNDMGEFSVKVNKLESQYALLKANGFYRNEVTGEKSKSQVTLYALTDLSKRDEVNVNLLTHLSYERSLYLATEEEPASVTDAKKQAETEVLKSFEIEGNFDDAEDLNIFGESDQSAALLAVSVLMQGNLSEGDFSERLANYAADVETDGVWNDSKTATKIADWANSQGLGSGLVKIRENITKWELSADVPAFEKYVNNFWWQNYGLGICDSKREDEVLKNQNSMSANIEEYYICKSSSWMVATDIEKDTYKWEKGKDADVKNGDVVKENCYVFEGSVWREGKAIDCSLELRGCTRLRQDTVGLGSDKVWYICDAQAWRDASTYEKDTFGWKDSTDGAIKKGNVTDSIYVFDKTKWRATSDVEAKLGGCVSAIADSVGKVESIYYICKSDQWTDARALEYDTYKWIAGKDGDSKVGSVNESNCYVFEDKAWRSGNLNDCSLGLRGCTALRQDTVGLGSDKEWHICDAQSWRNATTYEKDTFGWKDSTDGAIKKGKVTDSIYVFDKTVWRTASNVEAKLGGCVSAIADSVGKVDSTYYICKANKWVKASATEYDTYHWPAGKDADSKYGDVNADNCYVFEDNAWRAGNKNDCTLNLRGCTLLREDSLGKSKDGFWYKCVLKAWRPATNIEIDTASWGAGENGEVRTGRINKEIYYTYDGGEGCWRVSFDIEKDTYQWTDCVDGVLKKGAVTGKSYVCENDMWRKALALEDSIGSCTKGQEGKVYKNGGTVCFREGFNSACASEFQCANGVWIFGAELETYRINAQFGECVPSREGDVVQTDKMRYFSECRYGAKSYCTQGVPESNGGSTWLVCSSEKWQVADDADVLGECTPDKEGQIEDIGVLNPSRSSVTWSDWRYSSLIMTSLRICKNSNWNVPGLSADSLLKLMNENGGSCEFNKMAFYGRPFYSMWLEDSLSMMFICNDRGIWQVATKVDSALGVCAEIMEGEERTLSLRGYPSQYVCKNRGWHLKTIYDYSKESLFNSSYSYGTMTDPRDGKEYRTTTIGNKIWMAENIDYADSITMPNLIGGNWCYDDIPENCSIGGRLYTWTAAMNLPNDYNRENATISVSNKHQGICPDGWHVPNDEEWSLLAKSVNVENLVSSNGWEEVAASCDQYQIYVNNSTDEYGFSIVPVGTYYGENISDEVSMACYTQYAFDDVGYFANFWTYSYYGQTSGSGCFGWDICSSSSSSQQQTGYVTMFKVFFDFRNQGMGMTSDTINTIGQSVRCIKDADE